MTGRSVLYDWWIIDKTTKFLLNKVELIVLNAVLVAVAIFTSMISPKKVNFAEKVSAKNATTSGDATITIRGLKTYQLMICQLKWS